MLAAVIVAPDSWYLLWWTCWSVVFLAAAMLAARLWLVNPIIRAIEKK